MSETNDEKVVIDSEDLNDFEEPKSTLDEIGTDTTDWKAEALKRDGMARRFQTKLKKLKEFEKKAEAKPKESKKEDKKEFDLAEKSYLLVNGIKKEQIAMVWEETQKTGKSIDELLESPYFKEKLEMEVTREATPSGSKRSGGTATDSVDYWLAKGQYPPNTPDNRELRQKVAKALANKATEKSKFSDRSIV